MKSSVTIFACFLIVSCASIQGEDVGFKSLNGRMPETPHTEFHRYTRESENTSVQDNHTYYLANFYSKESGRLSEFWVDLSKNTSHHVRLSESYRIFIEIPFQISFYGHKISSLAITTSGFISTFDDNFHSFIQLTQYIAPFSADFNPSQNSTSKIYYRIDADRLIVQWDNMTLDGRHELGEFSFEAIVYTNGTILFLYENIPTLLNETSNSKHTSLIGVSDAFIVDYNRGSLKIRVVYNYHRVRLGEGMRLSGTVYQLDPLPNCVASDSFQSCRSLSCQTNFNCGWCSRLQRCSDGIDRFRQSWTDNGCDEMDSLTCDSTPPPEIGQQSIVLTKPELIGLLVGLIVFLLCIVGLVVFIVIGSIFVMKRVLRAPKKTVKEYQQFSM